jgi:class 3 adenylate cyclase
MTVGHVGWREGRRRVYPAAMEVPETRYTKTADGVSIAYQVFGEGPVDFLGAWGEISNLDLSWEIPELAAYYRRLASFSRVLTYDRRGTGLSDHHVESRAFEDGMEDIGAVMDAAGSERALLFGWQDGGMLCSLFAASFPERVSGLVLYNTSSRTSWAPDHPWGWTDPEWDEWLREIDEGWGTREHVRQHMGVMEPDHPLDAGSLERWTKWFRGAGSPGDVIRLETMVRDGDIRGILSSIHVPTLVIATEHTGYVRAAEEGRYLAERITGAELVQLPTNSYTALYDVQDLLFEQIERFARRVRDDEAELDRVLATVLFTDIVDSTAQGAAMGDRAWTEVRAQHDQLVRASLARFRGREIKTMGDGFLATFDGPARGVRCAQAIIQGIEPLGIEVRAGLHTGEVTLDGDDVAGLGVAIGARVGAKAGPSQVLVSQTVKDLVAGSGLTFEDAGEHELKGVPDRWHLYQVVG